MSPVEHADKLSPTKRALYEIRALKERVAELQRQQNEPIAITGIGLRFPGGASTPEAFWDLLAHGVDAVTEIPISRWPIDQYYDSNPDAPGKMYSRHGAFLTDPASFDADFFAISPREAMSLDPQHRLALEVAWEALENAGCSPASLAGSASGVFLALSNSDYSRLVFSQTATIDAYSSIGNLFNAAAGRISYLLGLQGPSLAVATACSGSLVAIHLACQSLRAGECSLALAGGVNLILTPEIHINFSKSRMMAQDGRCKTFDAAADGYVRGEGCGMVVLKRLSAALADGDTLLAVIRGSAINQDGRSGGMTAPNGTAQEALIRQALASAGLKPDDINYVETHGTGTSLGDPIEAHALAAVFGPGRASGNALVLGALKSNIGHLESAAGVAGLIKVVLALRNQQIPGNLHFQKLNPHIDWHGTPVEIPTASRAWPGGERPRLAGVSSFGFSGTNAHVILEEAPIRQAPPREFERALHILALSARSARALGQLEARYAEELARNQNELGDICFTANTGRAAFDYRVVYVGATREQMFKSAARGIKESTPEVVFLFPGQGAQIAGMGKELYQTQPVFRRTIDECAELLKTELETPLVEVLWGRDTELVDQTAYTQPALFAVEYALSVLWRSWGIAPAAVLGHSVGEYAAACVAGVFSLGDGLKLIATRARLMQQVAGRGAMAAVFASEQQVRESLAGLEARVSVAALNAPGNMVISGYQAEFEIVEERLRRQGIRVQRLPVSHAFHSPQMYEMVDAFAHAAKEVKWSAPYIQLISSVTGVPVGPQEMADAEYWRRQVRQPVMFRQAMEALRGHRVLVEVGPGTTLAALGRRCIENEDVFWAPSLRKGRGDWDQMLSSLAGLYVRGVEVDWTGFDEPYGRRRVALPTYPFERHAYWIEGGPAAQIPTDRHTNPETAWQCISESVARQSEQGPLNLTVAQYPERWAWLDKLTSVYIIAALRKLGLFQSAGERHSAASLLGRCGVRESYEKLIGRWLRKLASEGLLETKGTDFVACGPLPDIEVAPLLAEAGLAFTGDRIFLDYVSACGKDLAEILTGQQSPLETLFPGGSFTRAEDLYERAPLSAYFTSVARSALEGFVRTRRADGLRVLEIGAGTGATTSSLLPVLPPETTSYYFTDVSDLFLNHGERKFAAYSFVSYGHFDIERYGETPRYPAGSFDVIVATNVLHATKDLRRTVANVRSLLAPSGILILSETTTYLPWYDVTTGLIEGWQRFDDGLREDHPLLPVESWSALLESAGFDRLLAFPDKDSQAHILGQHVIVARTPPAGRTIQNRPSVVAEVHGGERAKTGSIEIPQVADWLGLGPARHERLVALVRAHLADMLRFTSPEQIERKRRLMDLGLDSLMAVELRTRLAKALAVEKPLSATLVFDYPTLDALADHLERDILQLEPAEKAQESASDAIALRAEEVEHLTDEEVETLLLKKLQSL